jgi:hypothetical protein
MYAVDRIKPPTPYRPDDKDDKLIEEQKANRAKTEEKKTVAQTEDEISKSRSE